MYNRTNLYIYADNSPTTRLDASGLAPFPGSPGSPEREAACRKAAATILNKIIQINDRYWDAEHNEWLANLPWKACGKGNESVSGHLDVIDDLEHQLWDDIAEYNRNCFKFPPMLPLPVDVPFPWVPVNPSTAQQTSVVAVMNPRGLPMRSPDLSLPNYVSAPGAGWVALFAALAAWAARIGRSAAPWIIRFGRFAVP